LKSIRTENRCNGIDASHASSFGLDADGFRDPRLEKNLQAKVKFCDAALVRFYRLIAAPDLQIIAAPSSEEITRYTGLIHPKDTHVLAGASKVKAAALLTLDRKHFCTPTIRQAPLSFEILTPGAFLHRLVAE
jgi:hypothetical protein